jgi:hypothetical protein
MSHARLHSQLRKPGGRGVTARYVEVGGSGGTGRTATAAPGTGDGEIFSGSGGGGAEQTHRASGENVARLTPVTGTCLLRHISGSARLLVGRRSREAWKSGVRR